MQSGIKPAASKTGLTDLPVLDPVHLRALQEMRVKDLKLGCCQKGLRPAVQPIEQEAASAAVEFGHHFVQQEKRVFRQLIPHPFQFREL